MVKRYLLSICLSLGIILPVLAGPSVPPSGNYINNVSTVANVQIFNVSSGTVKNLTISGTCTGPGCGGGGGTPGGLNQEVQFNNAGSFGGSPNFVWNGATLGATAFSVQGASGNIQGVNSGIGIVSPQDIYITAQSSHSLVMSQGTQLAFVTNSGAGRVYLNAPNATSPAGSQISFTLPNSSGTAGQSLITDGNGNLSLGNATAGPAGGNTQIQFNNNGITAGSPGFQFSGSSVSFLNVTQLISYANPGYAPGADPTTSASPAILLNGTNFSGLFAVPAVGFSNAAVGNSSAAAIVGYTSANTTGAEGNGIIFLNSAGIQIANLGVNGSINGLHIGTGVGQNRLDIAGNALIGQSFTRSGATSSGNLIGVAAPINGLAVQGNVAIGTFTATNSQVVVQMSTANAYGLYLSTSPTGGNTVLVTTSGAIQLGNTSGAGGTWDSTEGTPASGASGHDVMYADSASHLMKLSNNNGTFGEIPVSTMTNVANTCAQWSADGQLIGTSAACGSGSGGGTPSGTNYQVQVASPNATFAGYNNFTNNGSTITITNVYNFAATNVSTLTLAGVYMDLSQSTMTASSVTVTNILNVGSPAKPISNGLNLFGILKLFDSTGGSFTGISNNNPNHNGMTINAFGGLGIDNDPFSFSSAPVVQINASDGVEGSPYGSWAVISSSKNGGWTYSGFTATSTVDQSQLWAMPRKDAVGLWKSDGSGNLSISNNVVGSTSSAFEFSSDTSTAKTNAFHFSISTGGYLSTNGSSTTISGCGSGPSSDPGIDDNGGGVTPGSTAAGCTITFSKVHTRLPACVVTEATDSLVNALSYTVSTSAITVTQTSLTSKLYYVCIGKD